MKKWRCMIGLKCKLYCFGCGQGFLPAQHFRSNSEVFGNDSDLKTLSGFSLTDFADPRQLINEMKQMAVHDRTEI